jgi:Ca2+-binding EF-hand superfamily protein
MVRADRGASPPLHSFTHSYDYGRDGEITSFLSEHQAGAFDPNVDFSEWRADDAAMRTLASDAFSRGGILLEKLNLSGCHNITDTGLMAVLPVETNLETKLLHLNLSGMGGHLTDAVLVVVSQTCALLEYLSVSGCRGFSDVGFGAVAGWQSPQAQRLWSTAQGRAVRDTNQDLRMGWDWGPSTHGSLVLSEKEHGDHDIDSKEATPPPPLPAQGVWCGGLAKLRRLVAEGCGLYTDKALVRLPLGCPLLEHLDISSCPRITDDGLRPVIDGCKELISLKCRDNADGICGNMFRVTAHSHNDCSLYVCCGLRSIDISGCANFDDNRLAWLAQSCVMLENVDISNCPHLSTRGIARLVKQCPRLVVITALNVGPIGDAVGRAITSTLPNVVSLDLAGASGLTALSLASLLQTCRRLEHINFSGIPGLSDSVFTGEADVDKNMETLRQDPRYADSARTPVRSLYVGGPAPLLKDPGFAGIAWLFRFATVLDVSGCVHFGNTAVYHVSEHCRALTDLNMNRCDRVTDIGVKRIASRCRKLEVLRLSATPDDPRRATAIGESSLGAILRRLRLLRVLEFRHRVSVRGTYVPGRPDQDETQFIATELREVDFAGCTEMQPSALRNILACTPHLTRLNVAQCRFVVRATRRKAGARFWAREDSGVSQTFKPPPPKGLLKKLLHLLPRPEILEVVSGDEETSSPDDANNVGELYSDGVPFQGIRGVDNLSLLLKQQRFRERYELEVAMAVRLQERWRGWRAGEFTLLYLVLWTNKLRRKAKTIHSAITMQKYWRRKIGQRLAWERRRVVSAECIQRSVRAYHMYKRDLLSHLRHASRLRLQQWWRTQLYLKRSLRDRIWACVQEQKRKEEDERRLTDGRFFAARTMQNWQRRVWASRELERRQRERREAIWGSALIVPSRPWRRSRVHALPFEKVVERRVITVEGGDLAEIYLPERDSREARQQQRRLDYQEGKRPDYSASPSKKGEDTEQGTAREGGGADEGGGVDEGLDPSLDTKTLLAPHMSPRVAGSVRRGDVKIVRRYPGRYCGRCKDRHAVVYCSVCLDELCPRCNFDLHSEKAKYAYHPPAGPILPRLPADVRMAKQLTAAKDSVANVDWNLRHVTHVRAQRLATHDELLVEIERRKEIRKRLQQEADRQKQVRIARSITLCAACWRGLVDRRKYPDRLAEHAKAKARKEEKTIHMRWTRLQSLVRGVQLRKWHLTLRMDDKYLFWTSVNRRKISLLPGKIAKAWEKAAHLLNVEFPQHIAGKRNTFATRFGRKARRYNAAIKSTGTKITRLAEKAGVVLKQWHALVQMVAKSGVPFTPIMKEQAIEFESEGRRLEAESEGWGRIQILMKNRLAFLKDREAYEVRRDAVLRAQGKAYKLARANIERILKETHLALEAIEGRMQEPEPDFEKMNAEAEALFEKVRLAEEAEEQRRAEREGELRKANAGGKDGNEEEEEEKREEDMTEEERLAHETERILEEQAAKKKAARLLKEKEARSKKRLRTWRAQWSKRGAWLRREHARAIRKVLKGEKTVLAMAMELVGDRSEELRMHALFDQVQSEVVASIQAEIHYEAEVMQTDADCREIEVRNGPGAEGILESVHRQVALREKQHMLHKTYAANVLDCVAEADAMTLRRERFIVADWSDAKNYWVVYARPKRFEHAFSFDAWCMDAREFLALCEQKPWIDFMQSGKEESNVLKSENNRFDTAIDEARSDQKDKEEREAQEKAEREAKDQAEREILERQERERTNIKETYGDVLSDLLTDVSPELTAQRERERRMKMKWHKRIKEDAYKFFYASKMRKAEEMRRIQESIEHRQKASVGYIEAICAMHITTGAETKTFAEAQSRLRLNNEPHFRKVDKNLGREWGVHLWTMKTIDQTLMVTKMRVGSAVTYNKEHYLDPAKATENGYQRTNEVPTEGEGSTQLVIWTKVDPNEKLVLHEVEASFAEKEEKFLQEDGFTRLDPDLGTLRMPPDGRLWAKWAGRTADRLEKAKDELFYVQKIEGYQKVLKEEPNNALVRKAIVRLEEDLRQWRRNEESKKDNKLRNMVEFLALDEKDMHKFGAHFAEIDRDGSGEIDLTEFCDYLDIDRTTYTDSIFAFLDESNDGTVDFAEFVHACGTILMWDQTQVLQFMFSIYDTAGNGYIVENQLQALLTDVAGDDPINIPGIDRVMTRFDKDGDGKVTWLEFKEAARRFPMAFIPAYEMLDKCRHQVMGKKFWQRKKLLFMKVREKMAKDRELAAEAGKQAALQRKAQLAEEQRQKFLKEKGSPVSARSPEGR